MIEPIGPITDFFRTSNYIEAGLWSVIGVGFVVQAARVKGTARRTCAIAAVAFLLFGGSDVKEAQTGAWWHPWWLLVWKGMCLAVFAALLGEYIWRRVKESHGSNS